MNIAILMTCHNRKDKTLLCLNSLYSHDSIDGTSFDIFLVDDGSTDGTKDAISHQYPNVILIIGDGNLFWNRGMILAWQTARATGKYDGYIWLNDDTNFLDGGLIILMNAVKDKPNSIIAGSICSNSDPTVVTYGGYDNRYKRVVPKEGVSECYTINGNIVFVPEAICKSIGILDGYYRHSKGDFDYGIRATKAGFKCFATTIIGTCDRNGNYVKWMDKKYSFWQRLKILYSPLGNNPFEAFHVLKLTSYRYAIVTFFYLHFKAVFPSIFPNRKTY